MGNVRKYREPILVQELVDANGNTIGGASGGGDEKPYTAAEASVTVADEAWSVRRLLLTITNGSFEMEGAIDGAGWKVATNPAGAGKSILGASMDLTFDFTAPALGTETFEVGLGTTQNVNSVLATTEVFFIGDDGNDLGGSGLTGRTKVQTSVGTATTIPWDLDNDGDDIYLNIGALIAALGTVTITVNGTITLYYVELGDSA